MVALMNIGHEFKLKDSDTLYVITSISLTHGNMLCYEYCPKHLVGKLHVNVSFSFLSLFKVISYV